MKLTAICNAGILVESDGFSLLIDGISRDYAGFSGLDDRQYAEILRQTGKFATLGGLIFSHCHPDHCDISRIQAVQQMLKPCHFFLPDASTPESGVMQIGPFRIEYVETPHMPHNGEDVRHFVFLICVDGQYLYFISDSMPDAQMHFDILGNRKPDWMFVNPVHLSSPDTKHLLLELAPKHLVAYHIPIDPGDQTGIRRKAMRTVSRDFHFPVTLVTEYPMYLGEM